ncbi:MAG TPA: IS66 family transposase [Steroidobacteraceae bacterium]|nr:IS66 family transposase [Steroidobacteraceae bacterium]
MHPPAPNATDAATIAARLAAREERIKLLEEENRWLKAQLFGRSSEKTPAAEVSPDQHWLFNEAEGLAQAAQSAPQRILIPTHERKKRGRKPLSPDLPRAEVLHDLPDHEKVCAQDGTALERIGEEISEQLDYKPAQVRVLRHIRPKYSCPSCRQGVQIAPTPPALFPKSLATPALLAHSVTAKFVDGLPLYRQETQFERLGVTLGRATMAGWVIRLGGTYLVPLINLLNEQMLEQPLVHCDETSLQVLHSDKAPTADHWMWVRASGPPGKRIVLFDYDPSRGGTVPKRLLQGYQGILLTDGYEPYAIVAAELNLVHGGCMAHARRKFDEARKATPGDSSHAKSALDFIRELYLIEHTLWDRERPLKPEQRVAARRTRSAPIMERFHSWLQALSPQVLPESRLGKAALHARSMAEADHLPCSRRSSHRQQPLRERHSPVRPRSQGLAVQ